ncbi:MAG: hypothetical protein OEY49_14050, partial [Candidatus Heimdallarchaeota archaeon]|nr:hypothetical protein [Candidatus Heimdallarchaeota archaeon]
MKGIANNYKDRNSKWLSFNYRLAHHPTCDNFTVHFYHIRKMKICRGCFMVYTGMLIGIPLIIMLYRNYNLNLNQYYLVLWIL